MAYTLIAFSLFLIAAVGLVGLIFAGRDSRSANDDERFPRGRRDD